MGPQERTEVSKQVQGALLAKVRIPELRKLVGEKTFVEYVSSLSGEDTIELFYDWRSWAREEQLEPSGRWSIWLYLAGRGAGKTRSGCEWVRDRVKRGVGRRIALVSQSAADARDVLIEGEAGLLAVHSPYEMPKYESSKRRITWKNGAVATIYTAEDPDQLRGPSHDTALVDELAVFKHVKEVWSNLMFGLRLGDSRAMVMTTPRPIEIIKDLLKREGQDVYVTRGTTYDNIDNLSDLYKNQIIKPYEGTRLGRQELHAEVLEDVEGALWNRQTLDENRRKSAPKMKKIVVSIDPMGAVKKDKSPMDLEEERSQTGIIVAGLGVDGHGYCLADLTFHGTPKQWASKAIGAYKTWEADRIIAEKNFGGDMVEEVIVAAAKDVGEFVPITLVWASCGKLVRAEPVSTLDEQHKIHLVGEFARLEDELCTYEGEGQSPNRLDAYVWAFSYLMVKKFRMKGATWGRKKKAA